MSRFFDAVRLANGTRQHSIAPPPPAAPRGRTLAVVSNKGGVGKTTVATNLAVYLRAVREDLPILLIGLDDQPAIDRMFAIESCRSGPTVADALRAGSLTGAIRLGNYGVHYVPTSPRIGELKREISDPDRLRRILAAADWRGLVLLDTKSDLEILSQNALRACDLALVLARNLGSVEEAAKVFELLRLWGRPRDTARILLSQVDLRVKYAGDRARDLLSLLLEEIRRLEFPLLGTFVSSSPKVESLHTNPDRLTHSILYGAPSSVVHRQMRHLTEEVLAILWPDSGAEAAVPEADADEAPVRALGIGVAAWLEPGRAGLPAEEAALRAQGAG